MKFIFGIIPGYDVYALDKAMALVRPGLEEIAALTPAESNAFQIYLSLRSGARTLVMSFVDTDTPPDKQQFGVMQKLILSPQDYSGFYITELAEHALHLYQVYVKPEYRTGELITLGFMDVLAKAKNVKAPYLTTCTKEKEIMQRMGFAESYTKYQLKLGV